MKTILHNRRGASPVFTAVFVLLFALLTSVLLYFASVQIQCMVIRQAMKTGLSNLLYTVTEDTYTALREGNFEAYAARLTGETSYVQRLRQQYRTDVESTVDLRTPSYSVSRIRLDFTCDGKKIRCVCTCRVTFYVTLFGKNRPATVRSVRIEGSHTAKYGRPDTFLTPSIPYRSFLIPPRLVVKNSAKEIFI